MEHMHGHRERAPRGRFRGRRRYFRRVHREAAAFQLAITPDAWGDLWHYHADWPGWGNVRWRYRVEHTPNATDTPFPFAPELVSAEMPRLTAVLQALLADFTLDFATHTDDDGHTTHWAWARGVGEPLVR